MGLHLKDHVHDPLELDFDVLGQIDLLAQDGAQVGVEGGGARRGTVADAQARQAAPPPR